ncbi:MAG TPA: divalent cation tolerance protein CutA [Candidatus Azoamicus sp. OHIO1]
MNVYIIICNYPNNITAEKTAINIIKLKMSHCVTILKNIQSIYMYKNKIYKEKEFSIIIKTEAKSLKKLIKKIITTHPYKNPEIVTLKILKNENRTNRETNNID